MVKMGANGYIGHCYSVNKRLPVSIESVSIMWEIDSTILCKLKSSHESYYESKVY